MKHLQENKLKINPEKAKEFLNDLIILLNDYGLITTEMPTNVVITKPDIKINNIIK